MDAASSSTTRAMVDFIVAPAQTQLPAIVTALLPLVKAPLPAPQAIQAWLKCKDVVFSRCLKECGLMDLVWTLSVLGNGNFTLRHLVLKTQVFPDVRPLSILTSFSFLPSQFVPSRRFLVGTLVGLRHFAAAGTGRRSLGFRLDGRAAQGCAAARRLSPPHARHRRTQRLEGVIISYC